MYPLELSRPQSSWMTRETRIRYSGVVFTEYRTVGFPSESLPLVEALTVFDRCFARNDLYGVGLLDSGNNGLQPPGFFIFELNGRGVASGGSFPSPKSESLVYGDRETCGTGQSRLSVDITFEDSPEDIRWILSDSADMEVLSSTETAVVGATTYTEEFAGNRLYVDRCLSGGAYTFSISDFAGGNSVSYRLLLNGSVLKAGNVPVEKESTIVNVEGAASPTFLAPSSRDATPTVNPTFNPTEGDSLPPDDRPSTRPSQPPSFVPTFFPVNPVPSTTAPITPGPTLIPTPSPTLAPIQVITPEPTASSVTTPRPTLTPTLAAITFSPTPNPTPASPTPNPTPSPAMTPSPIVVTQPNASNGCANLGGACNVDFDCCSAHCTTNVCASSIPVLTPTFPPVPTFSAAPLPYFRPGAGGTGAGRATMPQKRMMRMELPSNRRKLVAGKQEGTEEKVYHRGIN
jgi:hypothetical protein